MAYHRAGEGTERYRPGEPLSVKAGRSVVRAVDLAAAPPAPVVVKRIVPAGPAASGAFLRAMAELAGLRHPALPALLDFGVGEDGNAFLVFEELAGDGLEARTGGAPGQLLPLLAGALDGLEMAAGRGLALHNLAPDNLLVVPRTGDDQGLVVLLGWGTRYFRPPEDDPDFVAPEAHQRSLAGDGRADLWSLARIACRLLGVRASGAGTDTPRLSLPLGLRFELEDADGLERALAAALHRDPDRRPTTAELRRAMLAAAAGTARPGAAEPAPPPVRLQFLTEPPDAALPASAVPGPAANDTEDDEGDSTNPVLAEHLADWLAAGRPGPAAPVEPVPVVGPWPAAPGPGPGTVPAEPAAAAVPPQPRARRRPSLLPAAAAAVLLLALALGLWVWRRPAPPADTPEANAAGPAVPGAPAASIPAPAGGSAGEPLPAALVQASAAFAAGDDTGARRALAALGPGAPELSGEACEAYLLLDEALAAAGRERLASDLRQGLETGDLRRLAAAVRAVVGAAGERDLLRTEPALRAGLAQARRIVDLHTRLDQAAKARDHAQALELAAALQPLVPRSPLPAERRDAAAAALEQEAELLADSGDLGVALARLESLRQAWPERPGLAERVARLQAESRSDEGVQSLLAAAEAAEARRRPDEGLAVLRGAQPTPRTASRLQDLRQRLERQLAQLDRNPPAIELPAGELIYEKGKPAVLEFRVSDDYQVESVVVRARPEGARAATEIAAGGGPAYRVEIPASLHQNRPVEVVVAATDLSGHTAESAPRQVRRKGLFGRLRGGRDGG